MRGSFLDNLNNNDISAQEEIRKIKKQSLKVWIFWFLAFLLYLIYWVNFEEDTLVESKSPFGDREVIINEVGNWFLLDSDTIKIYFKEAGRTRNFKKVDVDNFRESNSKERYNIVWRDGGKVSITMVFEKSIQGLDYNFSTNTIEMGLKTPISKLEY